MYNQTYFKKEIVHSIHSIIVLLLPDIKKINCIGLYPYFEIIANNIDNNNNNSLIKLPKLE